MSATTNIKHLVKTVTVYQPNQKISFEIRHPANAEVITGIAVTCDLIPETDPKTRVEKIEMAGNLTLAIAQKGDVFFAEDVQPDKDRYSEIVEESIGAESKAIGWATRRNLYLETRIKINEALLEGYYEDIYSPAELNPDGSRKIFLYRVRIYIQYSLNT